LEGVEMRFLNSVADIGEELEVTDTTLRTKIVKESGCITHRENAAKQVS
jgi:hypothetical protein